MTHVVARLAALLAACCAVLLVPSPASAHARFPDVITLPDGYRPEGIASGRGSTFYVGSIPTGAVRVGDFETGVTAPLVPGREGRAAIGLKADRGLLYVAGGPTGKAFVYDARTGADVAVYTLTTGATFVNDVALTRKAAYFTDSVNPVIYRIARDSRGRPGRLTTIPITGDLQYVDGFNANGIAASRDGSKLYVVQSATGKVFAVSARTGRSKLVAEGLANGDGLLRDGRTLYVVQNRLNLVAAVDLKTGKVVSRTSSPLFDVPTTIAEHGNSLYAVNARFGVDSPGTASYSVVRIAKP